MEIKNLNSKLKSSVVVLVLGISLAAGITFASVAWVAQWQGTGWISDGSVIDASKMKDNFRHLHRLGWRASSETNTIFRPHGRVGIGTNSPSTKLDVMGRITATAFLYSSDERLKDNIKTISGLELISQLRGVTYNWKKDGTPSAGVIAQEVEKVLPSAVKTNNKGMKSVNYSNITAVLVEAIKDQQSKIKELEARLESLENKL